MAKILIRKRAVFAKNDKIGPKKSKNDKFNVL